MRLKTPRKKILNISRQMRKLRLVRAAARFLMKRGIRSALLLCNHKQEHCQEAGMYLHSQFRSIPLTIFLKTVERIQNPGHTTNIYLPVCNYFEIITARKQSRSLTKRRRQIKPSRFDLMLILINARGL